MLTYFIIFEGINWVDFLEGGKLVASVHPAGQEMGATNVQAYIHTGSVRVNSDQYYHNRNITIQPANSFLSLTDSVLVRFYFLDSETEALLNATGSSHCHKPSTAYDLGVSKYSDPDNNFENGTVADDNQGVWTYITSARATNVPFDKGYYAEFKVNNFSEFWLNNGGFNGSQPLPVQLVSFTARNANAKDVLAGWITASEYNVSHFEIEVAKGIVDFQQSRYKKFGEVKSRGNSDMEQQYDFTDTENNKTGVRYYRLKIVVLSVIPETDHVVVQGVDIVTKHVKPSRENPQGGIQKREAPIHLSNVMLADPKTGDPTRVRFKTLESGTKVRVAVKSGEQIDK